MRAGQRALWMGVNTVRHIQPQAPGEQASEIQASGLGGEHDLLLRRAGGASICLQSPARADGPGRPFGLWATGRAALCARCTLYVLTRRCPLAGAQHRTVMVKMSAACVLYVCVLVERFLFKILCVCVLVYGFGYGSRRCEQLLL